MGWDSLDEEGRPTPQMLVGQHHSHSTTDGRSKAAHVVTPSEWVVVVPPGLTAVASVLVHQQVSLSHVGCVFSLLFGSAGSVSSRARLGHLPPWRFYPRRK